MSRIEELERRVRQDPASVAFGALAEEYRRAGRLEDAVAACRSGLGRHPSYLSARVTLGRALQELGQSADARAEFDYVLSLAPDNLAAIRGLADLDHGTGMAAAPPRVEPAPAVEASPNLEPAPALDWSIDQAADQIADRAGTAAVEHAERAAQIERLEIWLTKLEQARETNDDSAG